MSEADNEALTLAVRQRADVILCDERAMRLMAKAEGIRPLGTLGILLKAARNGLMAPPEAGKATSRRAGAFHGFRIGIELYGAALAEIEKLESPPRDGRHGGSSTAPLRFLAS